MGIPSVYKDTTSPLARVKWQLFTVWSAQRDWKNVANVVLGEEGGELRKNLYGTLTDKQLETQDWFPIALVTDARVLRHQAIRIHNAD